MNTVHIEQVITNGYTNGWIVVWDAHPGSRETATKFYDFEKAKALCDLLNSTTNQTIEYIKVYP